MGTPIQSPLTSAILPYDHNEQNCQFASSLLRTPSQNVRLLNEQDVDNRRQEEHRSYHIPLFLHACPRSTIRATGAQVGAVFGTSSGGGSGSLTYDSQSLSSTPSPPKRRDEDDVAMYDENDEKLLDCDDGDQRQSKTFPLSAESVLITSKENADSVLAWHTQNTLSVLASPRQTRAPPCTPLCNDEINGFNWQSSFASGAFSRKNSSSAAVAVAKNDSANPSCIWGMPRSDTFGILSARMSSYDAGATMRESAVEDSEDEEGGNVAETHTASEKQNGNMKNIAQTSQFTHHTSYDAQKDGDGSSNSNNNAEGSAKAGNGQRKNSFFTIHLSSSLLRAKKVLGSRSDSGMGAEDDY